MYASSGGRKKKVYNQLETYFPELFNSHNGEYLENKRILLIKKAKLLQGLEVDELEHFENQVFNFESSPNHKKRVNFEKNLTDTVDSMAEHFPSLDPFDVSVFRFYSKISYLKKNAKTKAS